MAVDVYKDWLGIPEGDRPPDQYQLLRLVQFEDDPEKVRNHYKKLNAHVRKYATGQYMVQSQELMNELAKSMLCLTDPQRKRDYDKSLGRTFEEKTDEFGRTSMGQVLVGQGDLSPDQLEDAKSFAETRGLTMRDALVQMKLVDAKKAAEAMAGELGLPFVEISEMMPDDSVLDMVPRHFVKRHTVLPLFVDDDVVLVACAQEPTADLEDELRLRFGMPMRAVIATPLTINQGIAKYYAAGMRDESVAEAGAATAGGSKRKSKQPRKPMRELSEGDQRERKQIAIVVICWAFIGSVAVDYYVIKPVLFPASWWPFLLTIFVLPAAIWYVLKVFLK